MTPPLTVQEMREKIAAALFVERSSPTEPWDYIGALRRELTTCATMATELLDALDRGATEREQMVRTAMKAGRALEVVHQELKVIDREAWKVAIDEGYNTILDDLRAELEAAEAERDALRAQLAHLLRPGGAASPVTGEPNDVD